MQFFSRVRSGIMALAPRRVGGQGAAGPDSITLAEDEPAVLARRPRPAPAGDGPGDGEHLDLTRTSLEVEEGLLMVLGPDGDPVPPAAFVAAAAAQPDASLGLPDGTRVPARRVAKVLAAQARGPLAETQGDANAWIRAMLGIGARPEAASPTDLEMEAARDGLEVKLVGDELVIGTPSGASFVIAAARAQASATELLAVLGPDGDRIETSALVAELRKGTAALNPAPATPTGGFGRKQAGAAEVALPGCALLLEAGTLALATPWGQRFRFVPAGSDPSQPSPVTICLADGEPVPAGQIAQVLGLVAAEAPVAPEREQETSRAPREERIASERARGTDEERESGTDEVPAGGTDERPARQSGEEPSQASAGGDPAWPRTLVPAANGSVDLGWLARVVSELDAPALKIKFTGLPPGFALSAGTSDGDDHWTFRAPELENLTLFAPPAADEDFDFHVTLFTPTGERTRAVRVTLASPTPEQATASSELSSLLDPAGDDPVLNSPDELERAGAAAAPAENFDPVPHGKHALAPLAYDAPEHEELNEIPATEPEPAAEHARLADHEGPVRREHLIEDPGRGHASASGASEEVPAGPDPGDENAVAVKPAVVAGDSEPAAATMPAPEVGEEPGAAAAPRLAESEAGALQLMAAASTDEIETQESAAPEASPDAVPESYRSTSSSRKHQLLVQLPSRGQDDPSPAVVLIGGLPPGARLTAGLDNGDGSWTVALTELDELGIELPAAATTDLTLSASAISIDRDGRISPFACAVRVGSEGERAVRSEVVRTDPNGAILDLREVVRGLTGGEPVRAIVIGALPEGMELDGGSYDPTIASWIVRSNQLGQLRLVGAIPDRLSLRVTAAVVDPATGKSGARSLTVQIDLPAERRPACSTKGGGGVGFWRLLSARRA